MTRLQFSRIMELDSLPVPDLEHMTKPTVASILALVALLLTTVPAATEFLPIDQVKPGMVGIGRTVFEGSKIEEFKVPRSRLSFGP